MTGFEAGDTSKKHDVSVDGRVGNKETLNNLVLKSRLMRVCFPLSQCTRRRGGNCGRAGGSRPGIGTTRRRYERRRGDTRGTGTTRDRKQQWLTRLQAAAARTEGRAAIRVLFHEGIYAGVPIGMGSTGHVPHVLRERDNDH